MKKTPWRGGFKDECKQSWGSVGAGSGTLSKPRQGGAQSADEVCALCGYERKYASKVLAGRRALVGRCGKRRGGSPARYGAAEREVIKVIWLTAEQPCGKRLGPALPLWLPY